jgi:hypothetical protein
MSYAPQRPGLAIAAGVLLIVYGGLGVLGSFCGAGTIVLQQAFQPPAGPGEEQNFFAPVDPALAKEVPSAPAVETIALLFGLALSVAMIAVGIGILQMRPLARVLAMVIAAADILLTLAHTAYSVILLFPVQDRLLDEEAKNLPAEMPFNPFGMAKGAMWGGAALGVVFTLAIWITVLFMLNSKSVRAAFADDGESPDPPRRGDSPPRYDGYDEDDELPPPPSSRGDSGITDRPS